MPKLLALACIVSLALGSASCGDAGSSPAQASAAGGAGGSGGARGQTDATIRIRHAAAAFHITRADNGSVLCPLAEADEAMGVVNGESVDPGTITASSCSVHATEDGFVFSGDVTVKEFGFYVTGSVAGSGDGTATLTLQTSATHDLIYGSPDSVPCRVTVMPQFGSALSVESGRIWAAFSCSVIETPEFGAGSSDCAIAKKDDRDAPGGYFYFDGCSE